MEGKLFLGQYLMWVMILLGQLHGYKSCVEKERNALFEIKKYVIARSKEGLSDYVLPTWTNDTKSDCCRWEGVKCNRTSGRVTEIAFGSQVFITGTGSPLNLSLLHPFEDVQSIDVSGLGFAQFNGFFDDVEGYRSLRRLTNLEILDLSSNQFNNSIFPFLNAATSLTTLFLRNNYMGGPLPVNELRDLKNLELLDLSNNRYNGSIPVQELSALSNLKALDLSGNEFSGSMELQGICQLKNMQELDLSGNKFVGRFPTCLTSLTELRVLDLSSNHMTGKVPSAIGSIESLEYLSLIDNDFEGIFSFRLLANLSKLKVFEFGSTSNSLKVEYESSWKPKFKLRVIALRSCNLDKVPHFLLHQRDLRYVDLSDNHISGIFPSWLLANNTELKALILQYNFLTSFQVPKSAHNLSYLSVSHNELSHIGLILPRLRYMNISNNGIEGNLPSSLGKMKSLRYLDLSYNRFQGNLPTRFVKSCYSLDVLKLSHNKLSGEIFSVATNYSNIWGLYMDNNLFTGIIGQGLRSLTKLLLLDISSNNLMGVIPSWIGKLQLLNVLLLSNNSLEGEIPISLFSRSGPRLLLDLSANNLSGDIPQHVNSTYPRALFLQDNNISGVIPDTLLTNVKILDLSNNRLSGIIPEFIDPQHISILLMRGNNLTGRIPRRLCGLRNIQLLNLANNRLNGSIPSCLGNTSFGLGKEDTVDYDSQVLGSFGDGDVDIDEKSLLRLEPLWMDDFGPDTHITIKFATKHRYDSYMGGNLRLLFGMDLSENELSGEIPGELGGLQELQSLNLSHNKLSGVIPESFKGLKNVESLDLSFNRLQGRIPPQLLDISSLSTFNVSFNNLSGVIPQGKQFNTIDNTSYLGNPLLCGQPTNRNCSSSSSVHESDNGVKDDDESTIDMVSFYWSFGAAYVTVLLGIFASLSFDSPWSRFWFYIVEVFIHKVRNLLW